MKQELIRKYGFKFIEETKWNEVYGNKSHTLIWNRFSKEIKIKQKCEEERKF